MAKELGYYTAIINPTENNGESISIKTIFYDSGDNSTFENQEITLISNYSLAKILIRGKVLTPEFLRKLADDIENASHTHNKKKHYSI